MYVKYTIRHFHATERSEFAKKSFRRLAPVTTTHTVPAERFFGLLFGQATDHELWGDRSYMSGMSQIVSWVKVPA